MSKFFISTIVFFIFLTGGVTTAYADQNNPTTLELRAIQTRKFAIANIETLANAIFDVAQEYDLNAQLCASFVKSKTIYYCSANGQDPVTKSSIKTDFLLRKDEKEKVIYLRISNTKMLQKLDKDLKFTHVIEADDPEFYNRFFRKIGDIIFIEAQKIDYQEIR